MENRGFIGKKFHKLTVLYKIGKKSDSKNKANYWRCVCKCGKERDCSSTQIKNELIKSCGCLPTGKKRSADMSGKQNNGILVLEFDHRDKKNLYYKCKCHCGKIFITSIGKLFKAKRSIKSCGCSQYQKGKNNKRWSGYGDISKAYWTRIIKGANVRNMEFSITMEYAWEIFIKQNKKCNLSGHDLTFPVSHDEFAKGYYTASLDRIDSNKGYIEGNIQWVHKYINLMKWDLEQEIFIQFCKRVAEYTEVK